MKMLKVCFIVILFGVFCLPVFAQTDLTRILPLLEKGTRTAEENRKVLDIFYRSNQDSLTFAAGASLVRIPPAPAHEAALFNILIKSDDALKQVFASVIIVAMGGVHEELLPILQEAADSTDPAIRAYAASAFTLLNPKEKGYADSVVNLYIYDNALAERAMNALASSPSDAFKYIRKASQSQDEQIRAAAANWLGDLRSKDAVKTLLKMAKKETQAQVSSAIAVALAKNKEQTLTECVKNLNRNYTTTQANTYALALGFMTGSAIDAIKQGLLDEKINVRINAARAASYMANVLGSDQADLFSTDKAFDIHLLKGLSPRLSAIIKTDNPSVKVYADNALKQIAKLI